MDILFSIASVATPVVGGSAGFYLLSKGIILGAMSVLVGMVIVDAIFSKLEES